jgi:hypothetical protein
MKKKSQKYCSIKDLLLNNMQMQKFERHSIWSQKNLEDYDFFFI